MNPRRRSYSERRSNKKDQLSVGPFFVYWGDRRDFMCRDNDMTIEQNQKNRQSLARSESSVRPYSPSWVDRLTEWVDRLPGPPWLFYLIFGLVLIFLEAIILWRRGTDLLLTLTPTHDMQNLLLIPYTLGGRLHYYKGVRFT